MGITEARTLLTSEIATIRRLARTIGRRHRLTATDVEDFASRVWLHLLKDDCRVLRQYRGGASVRTYLSRVIRRVLLDDRNSQWGKWRPTAAARREGPAAIERDRCAWRNGDPARRRPARTVQLDDEAERLPATDGSGSRIALRDLQRQIGNVTDALAPAYAGLTPEDQTLLSLRYREGFTVRDLAERFGVDQKRLYRRFDALHDRLRRALSRLGLERNDVLCVIGENEGMVPAMLRPVPEFTSQSGVVPPARRRLQPASVAVTS
jgi:RNA polymerase sigma factor (sigma-70 family)